MRAVFAALALFVTATIAAAQSYPAPMRPDGARGYADWANGWVRVDNHRWSPAPNDPSAPVIYIGHFGEGRLENTQEAILRVLYEMNIRANDALPLNELEAVQGPNAEAFMSAGHSTLNGAPSIFVAAAQTFSDETGTWGFVLHARQDTYDAWGGIAALLTAFDMLGAPSDLSAETLATLRTASPAEQLVFYEEMMAVYLTQASALSMATMQIEMQTLMMMMEFNYDLLFGSGW